MGILPQLLPKLCPSTPRRLTQSHAHCNLCALPERFLKTAPVNARRPGIPVPGGGGVAGGYAGYRLSGGHQSGARLRSGVAGTVSAFSGSMTGRPVLLLAWPRLCEVVLSGKGRLRSSNTLRESLLESIHTGVLKVHADIFQIPSWADSRNLHSVPLLGQ